MKNYTIIRSDNQYKTYCNDLEKLTSTYSNNLSDSTLDLSDTITLLIDKYDEEHTQLNEIDPIQLLKSLMRDSNMNQITLAEILQISKGHLSDILNYKKGLSKTVIRTLSVRFSVNQNAFNRPYKLVVEANKHFRNASLMNYKKDLKTA